MALPARLVLSPTVVGAGVVTTFTTEALLLAATPGEGVIAYAIDTDVFFYRGAGAWRRRPDVSTTRLAGDYTLTSAQHNVFCNTDLTTLTITLPSGVDGRRYRIINTGFVGNNVTIAPDGVEKIDGIASSITLTDGASRELVFETTEGWW